MVRFACKVFDLLAILPFYLDIAVRDLVPGSTTGYIFAVHIEIPNSMSGYLSVEI